MRQLEWYCKERRGCVSRGCSEWCWSREGSVKCSEVSVISGFSRDVDANCALLGSCAASSCNSLTRFWDNLSLPSSGVNNPSCAVKVPRQRPLILLVILGWGLSKSLGKCGYAAAEWNQTFALKSGVRWILYFENSVWAEILILGGLHEKHAMQPGICLPTGHLLETRKVRKSFIELRRFLTCSISRETASVTGIVHCRERVSVQGVFQEDWSMGLLFLPLI